MGGAQYTQAFGVTTSEYRNDRRAQEGHVANQSGRNEACRQERRGIEDSRQGRRPSGPGADNSDVQRTEWPPPSVWLFRNSQRQLTVTLQF